MDFIALSLIGPTFISIVMNNETFLFIEYDEAQKEDSSLPHLICVITGTFKKRAGFSFKYSVL